MSEEESRSPEENTQSQNSRGPTQIKSCNLRKLACVRKSGVDVCCTRFNALVRRSTVSHSSDTRKSLNRLDRTQLFAFEVGCRSRARIRVKPQPRGNGEKRDSTMPLEFTIHSRHAEYSTRAAPNPLQCDRIMPPSTGSLKRCRALRASRCLDGKSITSFRPTKPKRSPPRSMCVAKRVPRRYRLPILYQSLRARSDGSGCVASGSSSSQPERRLGIPADRCGCGHRT